MEIPKYFLTELPSQVKGNSYKFLILCHVQTIGLFGWRTNDISYATIKKYTGLDRKALSRVLQELIETKFIKVDQKTLSRMKPELTYGELLKYGVAEIPQALFHIGSVKHGYKTFWRIENCFVEDGSFAGNGGESRIISLSNLDFTIHTLTIRRGETGKRYKFSGSSKRISLGTGEFTIHDPFFNQIYTASNQMYPTVYHYRAYRKYEKNL